MLRTLDPEKRQLQELNSRLAQYLNRTKQLEHENMSLQREIRELRRCGAQRDAQPRAELSALRREVERLSVERSHVEMERDRLLRELHTVQTLCTEQTAVCRDVTGELRGCEQELNMAQINNGELRQRLQQLEEECMRVEDAHQREVELLRQQMERSHSPHLSHRMLQPISVQEVQDATLGWSESMVQTFHMYQQKVEEMERTVREEQEQMCQLQKEKESYATQLKKLQAQAQQQGHRQLRLEEEMGLMQEQFGRECEEYQRVIEELQRERDLMAQNIEQKMIEHQNLLQLRMDLGLELAAYRALLEGETQNLEKSHMRLNQPRERVIEIHKSSSSYSPKSLPSVRSQPDFRSSAATSSYRASPLSKPSSGDPSLSRVVPISVSRNQSPAARRDMISFTKSRAAQSSFSKTDPSDAKTEIKIAPFNYNSPITHTDTKVTSKKTVSDSREERKANDSSFINSKPAEPRRHKILSTGSMEEMIEKAIKPEEDGDTKVRYHVEKIQEEDGTTKTRIVLESKVEEELDVSKDSDLEEFLHQGTKKMTLEEIKDTATASMIKKVLSGVKEGENLSRKSINVEIIEEPVESLSEDGEPEIENLQTGYQEQASSYFQIEELDNIPVKATSEQWQDEQAQTDEISKESDLSFMSQDKERREYFVSTPDDFSESEEGCGITSYGHYGIVDDLSDERYYQDELLTCRSTPESTQEYKYVTSDRPSFKEGFPECILEEEVRVSPIVQESVLEFLREDSLEPKDQLQGALEKLQESVSGPLKEELAYLTKLSRESPDKVSVDVRKVEESSNDGTMTIVAELNVSQTLEESGLLDESGDVSEEQILAALRGAGLEEKIGGAGYSIRVSTEEEEEGLGDISHKDLMEKVLRGQTSYSYEGQESTSGGPGKVKEQRIVYLESPSND